MPAQREEPATRPVDPDPDHTQALTRALREYVRAVAVAVGVPADGTTFEVTDTITAYLALGQQAPEHPGRDLMLVWDERQGWSVSVETDPGESPVLLARGGDDPVPHPEAVARLVAGSAARRAGAPAVAPRQLDRAALAERMEWRVGAWPPPDRPLRTFPLADSGGA
ncbi:DUF6292 family protein [Saccharothrix longispora]|uniref:DUF6292 family protein n=1 Tax=Saccharothrix longispora TaxID=33920 RepID=UPI0028FD69DF|nr:DUF6292 family protein [Saccharothrix longispora]MBY8849925.1 DUF6292 family protein [Saccharothrix sp. MB29]MDU0287969.1 DUF6292 family protein [Saccharothrix longispora]